MRKLNLLCGLIALALLTPMPLLAEVDTGPDVAEPGSIDEIARATTEARFLSPWVSYLPASGTVPSPRTFLHRIAGAAGELVNTSTTDA